MRGKTAERGYDADHRRLRVQCFERDQWTCVDCKWAPQIVQEFRAAGIGVPDSDVVLDELRLAYARGQKHLHCDHVVPIVNRPDMRLLLSNLATRCNVCHNARTAREMGRQWA